MISNNFCGPFVLRPCGVPHWQCFVELGFSTSAPHSYSHKNTPSQDTTNFLSLVYSIKACLLQGSLNYPCWVEQTWSKNANLWWFCGMSHKLTVHCLAWQYSDPWLPSTKAIIGNMAVPLGWRAPSFLKPPLFSTSLAFRPTFGQHFMGIGHFQPHHARRLLREMVRCIACGNAPLPG